MIALTLYWILRLYLLVLLGRVILSWIPLMVPGWQPRGVLLVIVEGVYWLTDPPVRFLRKFIKPLRLGTVSLDLSVLVLFFIVQFASFATGFIPF